MESESGERVERGGERGGKRVERVRVERGVEKRRQGGERWREGWRESIESVWRMRLETGGEKRRHGWRVSRDRVRVEREVEGEREKWRER